MRPKGSLWSRSSRLVRFIFRSTFRSRQKFEEFMLFPLFCRRIQSNRPARRTKTTPPSTLSRVSARGFRLQPCILRPDLEPMRLGQNVNVRHYIMKVTNGRCGFDGFPCSIDSLLESLKRGPGFTETPTPPAQPTKTNATNDERDFQGFLTPELYHWALVY